MIVSENYLRNLLSLEIKEIEQYERQIFDLVVGEFCESLVLFGAGGLGKRTLKGLKKMGIIPKAFVDNNYKLWGKEIMGIPVISPEEGAEKYGENSVFIDTIWRAEGGHKFLEVKEALENHGCVKVISFVVLYWKYAEEFLPYYCLDLPSKLIKNIDKILEVYENLADDYSKKEYLSQLYWRMSADFKGLLPPNVENHYFPNDIFNTENIGTFIDCGAFNGDTIQSILNKNYEFERIIAFEPDSKNFDLLTGFYKKLNEDMRKKISIFKLGISDSNKKLFLNETGGPSSAISTNGSVVIECVSLDKFVYDSKPTFIKMDIEGAEIEALKGSRKIIEEYYPLLAISSYHKPEHFWEIPLLIKSINPNYHIYFRSHGEEAWDFVCYACMDNI